ncbi:outer membrane beta-barrel protein [Endothiovibrio diazotrophicus]
MSPAAPLRGLPGAVLFGLLSVAAGPLRAQDAPLPAARGFEPHQGIEAGGFTLYSRLQLGLESTSNVRLDPTNQGDVEKVLAIDAAARSKWSRHSLAATVSYLEKRASDVKEQKNEALSATLSGRIDLAKGWDVKLGVLSEESVIGKNDPMQFSGALNATNHIDTLEGALEWKGEHLFANLLARNQDIYNETHVDVTVLNRIQIQDRTERNLTAQLGRRYDWGQAYLFAGPVEVRYSGSAVILPEDRDSDGVRAGLGAEFKRGPWQGVARLIAFSQEFDAPTIPDVSSLVGTAQLSYQVSDRWSLAGALQRTFDETNITGSGGLFTNLATVGTLFQPRKDFYFKVGPSYRFYEIAGTSVEAESLTLDATAAWQVTERLELLLNATISNQTVNDPLIANLQYGERAATLSTVFTF